MVIISAKDKLSYEN